MKALNYIAVAAAALMACTVSAFAEDLENGETQFKKCRTCHDIGPNAKNKVGPQLTAIIGRKAAMADGFAYSDDLKGLGDKGYVWSEENLDNYIADPKAIAPNGKMVFAGLSDVEDRKDLIAYLRSNAK